MLAEEDISKRRWFDGVRRNEMLKDNPSCKPCLPSTQVTLTPLLAHLSLSDTLNGFSFVTPQKISTFAIPSSQSSQTKQRTRSFSFLSSSDSDSDWDNQPEIDDDDDDDEWITSIPSPTTTIHSTKSPSRSGSESTSPPPTSNIDGIVSQTPTPPPSPTPTPCECLSQPQLSPINENPETVSNRSLSPPLIASPLISPQPSPASSSSSLDKESPPIKRKRKLSSSTTTFNRRTFVFRCTTLYPNAPVQRTKKRKVSHRHYRSPVLVLRPVELGVIPISPNAKVPDANFTFTSDFVPCSSSNNSNSLKAGVLLPALIPRIQTIEPPSWWQSLALPPDSVRPSRFQPSEHIYVGTGQGWRFSAAEVFSTGLEQVNQDYNKRKRTARHAMSLPAISPLVEPSLLPSRNRAMSCPTPGTGYCQPFYLYKETQAPPQKAHLLAMLKLRMQSETMKGEACLRLQKWAMWNAYTRKPMQSVMDFNGEPLRGSFAMLQASTLSTNEFDDDDLYDDDEDSGDELELDDFEDDEDDDDEVLDVTMESLQAQTAKKQSESNALSASSGGIQTPVLQHATLPKIAVPSLPPPPKSQNLSIALPTL